jgi:hypothetical protein
MRRPKTLKAAKRRAWEAISLHIRKKGARDGIARCVTCNSTARYQDMHCGHFVHGLTYARDENGKLYVLEENLHVQDAACNTFGSGRLDVYAMFMLDTYGREMIDELHALKHKTLKITLDEYWEIEKEYAA